jgi:hypothetical protein
MAQQLWMGEEYVLQIDAHMRFVQVKTVRVDERCDSGRIDVVMSKRAAVLYACLSVKPV